VYLISTDYKYYANGASFFRKWNVNTALNLNFSYKINNGTKLYFGPQVRYQHLPTYNNAYPIKEYRLDYGLKIGFIKGF
jgi:long-subunit fatty acid transport protein